MYKVNLDVSNEQLRKEYEAGKAIYCLTKDHNANYAVIKRRLLHAGTVLRPPACQNFWSRAEDDILKALRKTPLSTTDISLGLFHRSRNAVCNRLTILRRSRGVV